jgi:hypothetical protein
MFGRLGSLGQLGLGSYPLAKGAGALQTALVNLVKDDAATALLWRYQNKDRRFATFSGGANPVNDNDPIGLDLGDSKWADKSYAQMIAAQPNLITDPGFDTGNGWSVTGGGEGTQVAGGVGTIKTLTNVYTALNRGGYPIGRSYVVDWDIVANRAGAMRVDGVGVTTPFSALARHRVMGLTTVAVLGFARNSATTDIDIDNVDVREIIGNHARQPTGNSRSKWVGGAKPYKLFDGVDDFDDVSGMIPGASGTIVSAWRPGGNSQYAIAGGTTSGDKRARLSLAADGRPSFALSALQTNSALASHVGVDCVMIQTWGGGQRRCYVVSSLNSGDALVLSGALTINNDGAGNSYKVGAIESAGSGWLSGRVYGTLIRNVETSDADIRNIIIPAFRSLYE